MIHADRHGKLRLISSPDEVAHLEASEDLLTSYVFGLLHYLPWSIGFGAVLGPLGVVADSDSRSIVEFWPFEDGTEPDVYIEVGEWSILMEAKLYSVFGDKQLGREWLWLRKRGGKGRRLLLLVVTKDPIPEIEIHSLVKQDLNVMGSTGDYPRENEVAGITWSRIANAVLIETNGLPAHIRAVLDDLRWVFKRARLNLSPFEGWDHLATDCAIVDLSSSWYQTLYFSALGASEEALKNWRRPIEGGKAYFGQ